jgi:hypothetical protein
MTKMSNPAAMKRYKIVEVVFTPLKKRIRYQIRSPLFCERMNGPVRNRGTYTVNDGVWCCVFGSTGAARRFLAKGAVLVKRMRLSTLRYDACDFALQPPPASTASRSGHCTADRRAR